MNGHQPAVWRVRVLGEHSGLRLLWTLELRPLLVNHHRVAALRDLATDVIIIIIIIIILIIIIIYTLTWSAHLHPLLSLSYARPGGHWYLEVSTIAIKCQQVISKLSTKVKFINWLVSNWLQVSNRLINKFCRNINQQVCWNYLLTCVNRCQQYG